MDFEATTFGRRTLAMLTTSTNGGDTFKLRRWHVALTWPRRVAGSKYLGPPSDIEYIALRTFEQRTNDAAQNLCGDYVERVTNVPSDSDLFIHCGVCDERADAGPLVKSVVESVPRLGLPGFRVCVREETRVCVET